MSFIWPTLLLSLIFIPLLVVVYIFMQQRRRRITAKYGSLGLVQAAPGRNPGLHRHIPPALFLLSLTILLVALGRPQMEVSLPRVEGTVILAFDVSGSMAADDMTPNRMEVAKTAAMDFVDRQPLSIQIGVVAFSDNGFSVQVPTNDREAIAASINRLTPTRGTSLANGILVSLNTIAALDAIEPPQYYSNVTPAPTPSPTPVPQGTYTSAAIVLLTDGENNESPDPLEAAQAAADRGVRIYTVGIGSPTGANIKVEGFTIRTRLDEAMLQQIAQVSDGAYFNAQNQQELLSIYENLEPQLTIRPEKTEITAIFAGVGILIMLVGGMLSLIWFSRVPWFIVNLFNGALEVEMDFLWPGFLFMLGLIPILVVVYIWMIRRRRRFAVRYSSLALVREALPHQSRLRRHLPFALFLLALASLTVALARPVTIASVPTDQTTIILSIDVSRSMCSTDILPSRLEAAQAAALEFIQRQKSSTQIGVVAFSGFAEIIQPPTTDSEMLQNAVESLMTGRRTAIGSGLLKALDAIAEIDQNVAPSQNASSTEPAPPPVPKGAYVPDIIVLLTDGVSNAGPLPVEAAQQAADRGVRVYTIGFGTANGSSFPNCRQRFLGSEPFGGGQGFGGGGGFGFGGGFRRGIDEETLQKVADLTGGEYYSASSSGELHQVFQDLPTYLITKHEILEASVLFTAIGAVLAGLAIVLSLLWHPLP